MKNLDIFEKYSGMHKLWDSILVALWTRKVYGTLPEGASETINHLCRYLHFVDSSVIVV